VKRGRTLNVLAAGLGENGISRVDEWLQQQQIPLAVNSHKMTAGFCSAAARIQARPV
jgi:hypothetical protein